MRPSAERAKMPAWGVASCRSSSRLLHGSSPSHSRQSPSSQRLWREGAKCSAIRGAASKGLPAGERVGTGRREGRRVGIKDRHKGGISR